MHEDHGYIVKNDVGDMILDFATSYEALLQCLFVGKVR